MGWIFKTPAEKLVTKKKKLANLLIDLKEIKTAIQDIDEMLRRKRAPHIGPGTARRHFGERVDVIKLNRERDKLAIMGNNLEDSIARLEKEIRSLEGERY